jgi:hypothetical protein
MGLAMVLKSQGKIDQAEVEFREVVRCESANVIAHNALGEILIAKGRMNEANLHLGIAQRIEDRTKTFSPLEKRARLMNRAGRRNPELQ